MKEMRTHENLAQHELIGLQVRVTHSADRKQQAVRGKVVDETKNMVVLERNDGSEVRIAKIGRRFAFGLDGAEWELDGRDIAFDPAERVKRCASVRARKVK